MFSATEAPYLHRSTHFVVSQLDDGVGSGANDGPQCRSHQVHPQFPIISDGDGGAQSPHWVHRTTTWGPAICQPKRSVNYCILLKKKAIFFSFFFRQVSGWHWKLFIWTLLKRGKKKKTRFDWKILKKTTEWELAYDLSFFRDYSLSLLFL